MLVNLDGTYHCPKSVVALGMFDGVHIGHRVLLKRGAALAHQRGVPLVVCTFADHPLRVIAPQKCPPMLCTFEERARLLEELGVDVLYAMPFTPEVMNMPPEDYVGHLVRRFHPTDVVCGYNHTFGQKGSGTPALLSGIGAALGFDVSVVPRITYEGEDVSSSSVRRWLSSGDADVALRLLGRPYVMTGEAEAHTVRLTDAGKQTLPDGRYRVLCGDAAHTVPASALLAGNVLSLSLPASCTLDGAVTVKWLSRAEEDD